MILDIITAILIVVPMAIGMARGVFYIAARALGWVGSLVVSFLAAPEVSKWLERGPVGDMVYGALEEKLAGPVGEVNSATENLPMIISGGINQAAENTADMLVQTLGGLALSVISFLGAAIIIRLLLILVIRPISRKRRPDGSRKVALPNKLGGLIIGGAEGVLLAFLFLAALIPVMNLAGGDTAAAVSENLRYSYLAGPLYDGNFLLVFLPWK